MRELIAQLHDNRLSRRGFIKGLAAAGLTLSSVDLARANVETLTSPPSGKKPIRRSFTGTGGELLVEQLRAAGVPFVFANPGSTEVGFFDALSGATDLKFILGLHEGIVVSMAHGYAQATNTPAFVNVHAIAGTAQMSGQLYNAYRDHIPIVATAGLVDWTVSGDDGILTPRPGFEQVDVNKQFTKLSWEVRRTASIPNAARRAFKMASTAPKGPVYVAFADYALTGKATADILTSNDNHVSNCLRPNADQVEQAAHSLLEARHPMFITGPQLARDGAVSEAVELADLLGVPVTDLRGHFISGSGFPTQHPLFYHRKALIPSRSMSTPQPLRRCDLCVGLDPDGLFSDDTNPSSSVRLPAHTKKVTIGRHTDAMGPTRQVDLTIAANIRETLVDLLDAVRSLATPERLATIRASRYATAGAEVAGFRKHIAQKVAACTGHTPMHPEEVAMLVNRSIDHDALTVHENFSYDISSLAGVLHHYGSGGKQRMASSGNCLGWGIGAAIGAKLGQPDRQVVLNIGDGATMFSAAGFWTMARYQAPVLTLVWNNENYQTVRYNFDAYGGHMAQTEQYIGMYLGNPSIDFVMLARSQGIEGQRVATTGDLQTALQRGIAATRAGQPYMIEVCTRRVGPGAKSTWHQGAGQLSQR